MPHPAETNWGVRSDTAYNVKNRRHPLRLTDEQILNHEVEPEIGRSAESPAATAPPKIVMQRTGDKNLNRFRALTSKIVNETEHTIKMSNGAVLINSGVAFRKITTPKK